MNYIILSPECNEITNLIMKLDAKIINLNENKRYYYCVINNNCISIWNDFTGIKEEDDIYLLEFRKYCLNCYNKKEIYFYIPNKSKRGNSLIINKHFLEIFKQGLCSVQNINIKFNDVIPIFLKEYFNDSNIEVIQNIKLSNLNDIDSNFKNTNCIIS
jgi:hypothetical protein